MTIHVLNQDSENKNLKKNDQILWGCWSFAALAILISYSYEFFWKINPCYFCKLQRIPYFSMILIIPIGYFISRKQGIKIATLLCLFTSIVLATTHTLIQMGWISDTCTTPVVDTIESFHQSLESVSCSEYSWAFLGLPISGYNALISFILSCILFKNLTNQNTKH